MAEKSNLRKELENEAKVKEILDRDQILELNKAMIEGKDLETAAKKIFGPGPDQSKPEGKNEHRVKNPNDKFYAQGNYH